MNSNDVATQTNDLDIKFITKPPFNAIAMSLASAARGVWTPRKTPAKYLRRFLTSTPTAALYEKVTTIFTRRAADVDNASMAKQMRGTPLRGRMSDNSSES